MNLEDHGYQIMMEGQEDFLCNLIKHLLKNISDEKLNDFAQTKTIKKCIPPGITFDHDNLLMSRVEMFIGTELHFRARRRYLNESQT